MAKKPSPKKPDTNPDPEPDPGHLPMPLYAPPEGTKIKPLDPPPPEYGGGTSEGDDHRGA